GGSNALRRAKLGPKFAGKRQRLRFRGRGPDKTNAGGYGKKTAPRRGGAAMSEYQYYEFQAIDRPLDESAMAALRAITSRAQITPTSLVNVYHFGSFK